MARILVAAIALSFVNCSSRPPVNEPPQNDKTADKGPEDPHLWLEEVAGEKQLSWVKEHNKKTDAELLNDPRFGPLRDRLLSIYDSKARIPGVRARGKWLYNYWIDEANPRGLWRRTTLAEYKKDSPKWEVILDVDALGKAEGESWVWHGASCLPPKYERCLVQLSRGGADADIVREFDIDKKSFIKDGFALPEAKTRVGWRDIDHIYVGTDFGPGSLTESGYPRIAKLWKRGTPLKDAKTIYEGKATDISVSAGREFYRGKVRDWVSSAPTFFSEESFLLEDDKLVRIEKPNDASVSTWDEYILISLRSDWKIGDKTWPAGALLATPLADYRAGKRDFTMLFTPTPNSSLSSWVGTKSSILILELQDVKHRLYKYELGSQGWKRTSITVPDVGSIGLSAYDEDESDDYWLYETGYTTPTTLWLGNTKQQKRSKLKANPSFFEANNLVSTQHFATSKDGTRVPYFMVARKDVALDGSNPTILYGYGGFEVSLTPSYSSTSGAAWLEKGGVMVYANIRGGGEYGPRWHKSALKENRQRAYDDFIAVAEHLISRKVTSTPKLGIMGGSNGGLLMGVMLTQRPDLFGAIVCQVPLLDMKRYHKLLAGASWMEEYGDPDKPEEWEFLSKFSPYHNLNKDTTYPRTLFTTSTRDDRVHPGHARKMVARMSEQGHNILYYENIEGGHGGAADNKQAAYKQALSYIFFARELGLK